MQRVSMPKQIQKAHMPVCSKSSIMKTNQERQSTPSFHRPSTQLDSSSQHKHCTKQCRRRRPSLRRNIPTTISSLQRTSNRPIKSSALSVHLVFKVSSKTYGPVNAANDTVANAIPNLVPTIFRFGVRLATHVGIRHWNAPLMMP